MSFNRRVFQFSAVFCAGLTFTFAAAAPAVVSSPAAIQAFAEESSDNDDSEADHVKVKIKIKSATLKTGKKKRISVSVKNASKSDVEWTSSNKRIATVTSKGVVKAKKGGRVTIRAKVDGSDAADSCKINVQDYQVYRMKTTGYCPGACCNGGYYGQTATGVKPKPGRTIAVDPRVIPLGSKVEIDGHMYRAEDTGGAIKGNRIDILFRTHHQANHWGVRYKTVKVYVKR